VAFGGGDIIGGGVSNGISHFIMPGGTGRHSNPEQQAAGAAPHVSPWAMHIDADGDWVVMISIDVGNGADGTGVDDVEGVCVDGIGIDIAAEAVGIAVTGSPSLGGPLTGSIGVSDMVIIENMLLIIPALLSSRIRRLSACCKSLTDGAAGRGSSTLSLKAGQKQTSLFASDACNPRARKAKEEGFGFQESAPRTLLPKPRLMLTKIENQPSLLTGQPLHVAPTVK
jgi:hypothetical protein